MTATDADTTPTVTDDRAEATVQAAVDAPPDVPPAPVISEIRVEHCYELLRGQPIGRIAISLGGEAPLVVPVNYVVDGSVVVFRSDAGTKMAATRGTPVSFEVDAFDPHRRTGWSVLIRGHVFHATPWEVAHIELEPWAGGRKRSWLRLVPESVTGRRLDAGSDPPDAGGDV